MRNLVGEHIVVCEGMKQINFNKMIVLNGTAYYLWEKFVGTEFTLEDVVSALLEKYDVEEEVARKDAGAFLDKLSENGVLEG